MPRLTNSQLLDITKELMAVESTAQNPAGLRKAYDIIVRLLQDSGKKITIEHFVSQGKPSLLAYKGSKRPKKFEIILNGHLDVVPGAPSQYQPVVKDGKLYGRGAYDMKAAAVILADTFCEFVDKVPFTLGLQIVTDEENAGKDGTLHQIRQGVRGDFVICGDCGRSSTAYEIANETKGIAVGDISFSGSSAHGAYPWRGKNAILQAAQFVNAVHARYPTPNEETFKTTVTVTAITTSNQAHTKVPDNALVKIDARFTAHDKQFASQETFAAFIKSFDPDAQIVGMYDFCKPAYCSPKNAQLLRLKAAAEKVEAHPFKFAMRHGTGVGRFYANVGDEACEFGIAGEGQHSGDEYITLEAFNNYRATMQEFMAANVALRPAPMLQTAA